MSAPRPRRYAREYLHGIEGPVVVLPGWFVDWLERNSNIGQVRVHARGTDPAVDELLLATRHAAMQWRTTSEPASDTGSKPAPVSEVAPSLTREWLTVAQAAGLIGITDRAVRLAITERRLPATRSGRAWQIERSDVNDYRAQRAA